MINVFGRISWVVYICILTSTVMWRICSPRFDYSLDCDRLVPVGEEVSSPDFIRTSNACYLDLLFITRDDICQDALVLSYYFWFTNVISFLEYSFWNKAQLLLIFFCDWKEHAYFTCISFMTYISIIHFWCQMWRSDYF